MKKPTIQALAQSHRAFDALDDGKSFAAKCVLHTLGLLALAWLVLPVRADFSSAFSHLTFHTENTGWVIVWVGSLVGFYRSSFPTGHGRVVGVVVFSTLAVLAALSLTQFDPAGAAHEFSGELDLYRGRCGFIIAGVSVVYATLLGSWARHAAPMKPHITGFYAALGTSAFGCLLMQVVCSYHNPLHMLLWHFVPTALMCFAGQVAGARWLRW